MVIKLEVEKLKVGSLFFVFLFFVSLANASAAEAPKKEAKSAAQATKKDDKSAAEAEKAKALQNPYANDLGSATLDVSKYPANHQEGYKLLTARCSKCHAASRPLNSQFAEPSGKDMAERQKKVGELKKSNPELFKNKGVLQLEADIWQRYVKRMMAKPGCEISKDEGKKIWDFLVYDSTTRKLGAGFASWVTHRKALLDEFKAKHPARYKELYEAT